MMTKNITSLFALMVAIPSFAGETWYLQTPNDFANLTVPSHWTNSTGVAAERFSADDVYVVVGSMRSKDTPNRMEFAGGKLQLGTGDGSGTMNLYSKDIKFTDLTLNNGTVAMQGYNEAEFSIDGSINVIGSNTVRWLYTGETLTLLASLCGDNSSLLTTHVRYGNATGNNYTYHRNEKLVLVGDCSGFAGKIKVTPNVGVSNVSIGEDEYFAKLVLAGENFSMPGAIEVSERCALEVSANKADVGSLKLEKGSILAVSVSTGGGLCVNESFDFVPPQRLMLASIPQNGQASTVDVIALPEGMELNASDFVVEGDSELTQFVTLDVKISGGRRILTVSCEPIVSLVTTDSDTLARAGNDDTESIAWGKGASWSNGITPTTGTNYVVRMQNGVPMYLRTPTRNERVVFKGKSLTVGTNCFLRIYQSAGNPAEFADLRLMGGSEVDVGQNTYSKLEGNITIGPGVVRFGVCNNESLSFDAPIRGNGDMWFSGPKSGTSVPQGNFNLNVDNPDFKGRMRVEFCKNDATYDIRREKISVGSELQLGGRLDAFDPKALTLRKYGRITTRDSFALTTAYNRGVFVDGADGGVFDIANAAHELELSTRLTLNGTLYKEGAGTLVMGGNVKFGEDSSDDPTEGANIFIVTNGTVKVTSADAMNGLATTFASGTSLVLAVNPDDAELTRYGIRNDKTDNPFSVNGGGTLPFSLSASSAAKAAVKGRTVNVGLFTVTAKADGLFRTLMPAELRSPFPSTQGTVVRSEADGFVTYSMRIVPVGLRIVVR
jgi:hypothetical protein